MSHIKISSSLVEMFEQATKEAGAQGYNHMVLFPRQGLLLTADDTLHAQAMAAENASLKISLKDISSDFISAQIGFNFAKTSPDRNGSQFSNLSFAAFRKASEQETLMKRIAEFDFYSEEKAYAIPYDSRKDALPQSLAITGSGTSSYDPRAFE